MLNKLMMGVALSAFALSGAMAQSNPSTPAAPDKPAAADSSTLSTSGASSATSTPSTGSSTATFVSTQSPDQWLASKFKCTDVVGTDDKKIGDVSDILFDKEGKIEAFVVSVGGFLGVGAKDVALAPTAFEVVKGTEGSSDKLRLAMSKDQLTQAQGFEPYKPPQATTGASTRPGGSATRPAGAPPPASSR